MRVYDWEMCSCAEKCLQSPYYLTKVFLRSETGIETLKFIVKDKIRRVYV